MIRHLFLLALALPAAAHEAPSGWAYPFTCCAGQDCREVAAVPELRDGYHLMSGEVVRYGDTRLRDSPDGEWHWCTVAGKEDGRTICLFVPPRGY